MQVADSHQRHPPVFGHPIVQVPKPFKEFSFLYDTASVVKRTLQAVIKASPRLTPKLAKTVAKISLLAGLNALYNLSKVPGNIGNLVKQIKLGDVEGTMLSFSGQFASIGDILDNTITFASSLHELFAVPCVAIFETIALPLGIVLLSYSTLKGIYDTSRHGMAFYEISQRMNIHDPVKLKAYLNEKLEVTRAEKKAIKKAVNKNTSIDSVKKKALINKKIQVLKAKKINQLERHTDKKVVKIMQNMSKQLKKNGTIDKGIEDSASDVKTLMKRRITVRAISTTATAAFLTTLVFTAVFPVMAPVSVPVVAGARGLISLGKTVYEDAYFTKGLKNPNALN